MAKKTNLQRNAVRKYYKRLVINGRQAEADAYRAARGWAWGEGVKRAGSRKSGTNPTALAGNGLQRVWEAEKREVVREGDPVGTEERVVVGGPRNVYMRYLDNGGVLRVGAGAPSMRKWRVACVREGEFYRLVGRYSVRSGDRL